MEIQQIKVDQETAWKKYREYRDAEEDRDRKLYAKMKDMLLYYQNHPDVPQKLKIRCQKARLSEDTKWAKEKQDLINECASACLEVQGKKQRPLTSADIPFGGPGS